MSEILKKYVCLNPFEYLDIQADSQYICCPSWCSTNIRNHGYKPVGFDEDLKASWLGETTAAIRKSVTDGSYSFCNKKVCPSLSKLINTGEVPANFISKEEFESKIKLENYQATPKQVLFGFDRSCNLKCPSCRDRIVPNDDVDSIEHKMKKFIIQSIEDNFSQSIETILITGSGDPIYSKIFREYLIDFDHTKYPNLKNIHLITNGQLLTKDMWNKLQAKNFIKTIEVSIDAATKETYENVTRLNGKWEALLENLEFLSSVDTIQHITFSMVVSQKNYKEMKMFYDIMSHIFRFSRIPFVITFRQIVHWNSGAFSIQDIDRLSIFNPTHIEHTDFLAELDKIKNLNRVDHNFHHLIHR